MPDNIKFSKDPAADLQSFLNERNYSRISLLCDENTHQHCYPILKDFLPPHSLKMVMSGEEHKHISTCGQIWQAMTDENLDRHSVLIVLGGGVLGDMGGFCAATYKRGIDFILIPTTLLSQVDASIGGKLGVDFNNFKNHIGVFQHPAFTLLSEKFLETLPQTEIRSGFAEVIKHILISDEAMWSEIKRKSLREQQWDILIRHSVNFKSRVVSEDPKEKGLRKILNAGHTIGHAIETYLLTSGRKVMHGEAIAAGMIAENYISMKRQLLSANSHGEITKYLVNIYGKLALNSNEFDAIAALALQDKKNKGNSIRCVLLEEIGKPRWDVEISLEEIKESISYYASIQI